MNLLNSALSILGIRKNQSSSEYFDKHRDLAGDSGNQFYGDGGTYHHSTTLDVDVDANGKVLAIWFRCRTLPFRICVRDSSRYDNPNIEIRGIEYRHSFNSERDPES